MNKIFLSFLLCSSFAFASLINGIALTVNDSPITLYDIDKTMQVNNVDRNQAASLLIDKVLYEQLVKKHNIQVDVFDVNEYIEKLASTNGMDLYSFKAVIKQQYPNYSVFENEARNAVVRQKLLEKIVKGNLKLANDEDMKAYYENNKDKFSTARSFDVIEYKSKNKASLVKLRKNPLSLPKGVQKQNISFETNSLQPQLQYLLNNTKKNDFTPIFTANRFYTTLLVTKKEGQSYLDFESVKGKIFNEIMALREKKYLKEYFEKEKLTADIKIVR